MRHWLRIELVLSARLETTSTDTAKMNHCKRQGLINNEDLDKGLCATSGVVLAGIL